MTSPEQPRNLVTLKPGRDRSVRNRHPWLFAGAIAATRGTPQDGDVIDVHASDGSWLARGTWSSASQIRVRLWTWDPDEIIDEALLRARIRRVIAGRAELTRDSGTTAYRLAFPESENWRGASVDRY